MDANAWPKGSARLAGRTSCREPYRALTRVSTVQART